MTFTIASININGMNTTDRQFLINAFLIKYRIDIVLCQEHNIKLDYNISKIVMDYDLYINTSILSKGGTAIFVRKKIWYKWNECTISQYFTSDIYDC